MRVSSLILLCQAMAESSSSSTSTTSPLPILPPPAMVDAFMRRHDLAGLELRLRFDPEDVPRLAKYRMKMRSYGRQSAFVNSSDRAVALRPLPSSDCAFRCNVRDLQLVPPPAGSTLHGDLVDVFASGARDADDVDFWLAGTKAAGDEGRKEAERLASDLPLDMDDRVYFYVPSSDSNVGSFLVLEAHKILPAGGPVVKEYARWSDVDGGSLRLVAEEEIWQRRRDMQGAILRVSTLRAPPYMYSIDFGERRVGDPARMTGMFADVFHTLQEILNFTYVVGSPEDGEWGANLGGDRWSGMIGQLQKEEIDIAVTDFTVTKERSAVMTFAEPITQIHHNLFIANPAGTPNYTAYIEPFDKWAWIILILIILVSPPLLYLAVSCGPEYEAHRHEFTPGKSFVYTAGVMTFMRPWSVTPTTARGRFAFACLLFGGTLTYYHWEAMLISYLATRVIVLPFNSLAELVSSTDFKIALVPGTSYEDAFKLSQIPLWQEAWRSRIEPEIDTYLKADELVPKIIKEPTYALYDNFYAIRTYEEYANCEIIAVPKKYDFKPYAYGFQKKSPLLGIFNFYINQMRERGTIKKIIDFYETRPQECPGYSGKPLGLDTCFTAFGLFMLGLLVASALMVCETCSMVGGKFLNRNLRHLESYGISDGLTDDEDDIMADPTFDERAKIIIKDKNALLRQKNSMLGRYRDLVDALGGRGGRMSAKTGWVE